jgi:N-acetyl-gamma-glutamyl-phosphate reductase
VPGWTYGLPELAPEQREALRAGKRIANPGCHATAFILLLRPLVHAGLVPADAAVSATSITGYSGGGKSMIAQYEAGGDAKLLSPRPYALGWPTSTCRRWRPTPAWRRPPVFMPVVASFYKGLAVSVGLHLRPVPLRHHGGAGAAGCWRRTMPASASCG